MAVKAGGATDPASRIERLVRHQEPRFRKVFLDAIALVRDRYTLDELAELLYQGRLEEALDVVDRAGAMLGNEYGRALSNAAENTSDFLSRALTVAVSFDRTNDRAVAAIRSNRLRMVQGFSAEQRQAVRQAMARGIAQGLNPRDQARLFRDTIGLTPRQERAVARYRELLESVGSEQGATLSDIKTRRLRDRRFDRSVQRAARSGRPLTSEQIDRMTGRYRERYIRYRSEVIARTEALRSAHQGSEEMYRQAIDAGELSPDELTRTWVTARDERVRTSHSFLAGEQRGIDEEFLPGLKYPGDPDAPAEETVQCRCVLTTRLDSLP